jgi:hypothetical protein
VAKGTLATGEEQGWMRAVAPASEDDMVALFLRAEVGSPRFGPQVLAALAHQGLGRSVLEGHAAKSPRRNAWRVMMANNTSTRLRQDAEVGVKCNRTRGCLASQAPTVGCLWVA